MATTWTNIQLDVRHYTNDSQLDVSTGEGLRVGNIIYQGMFSPDYMLFGRRIGKRWAESIREDTSLAMIVGTEQYTWPASPVFKSPFYIEGLDTNSSNLPYPIEPVPDMDTWSYYKDSSNSQPVYYMLLDVAGTLKIGLRPNPDSTDGIRITGPIEVTEFTAATAVDGTTKTVFRNLNADRALAMFIAADYKAKRGDSGRAMELITIGMGLLPKYDFSPRLRGGGFIQPWPA